MLLSQIQALIDAAKSGTGDLVSWSELKTILEANKNELGLRGVLDVPNTTLLQAQSGSNTSHVLVQNIGLFSFTNTGPANGTTIFSATGGGFWLLVLLGGVLPTNYQKETIELVSVSTYSISWTSLRLSKYGQWPSIATWIQDGATWRTALIEWEADDPDEPTEFTANFGGSVNVKIIIG